MASLRSTCVQIKWAKLLPREALEGSFSTDQAEYLYGRYHGQWIAVREGSVCEALPNEEEAGQTAALALCQNPQAKRALVIGSGLALCNRLLLLPQMEEVAWASTDPEYMKWLLRHVPSELWAGDNRFQPVEGETRRYLDARQSYFDLIIVNLPEVTGSAFNRYYTMEFYETVRASLRDGGVIGVSIAGGEGVLGAELVSLGASVEKTLAQVFSNLVLVPGDQTWLIASDSKSLTGDPAILRDRFAALEGAQKIFPPAGLLSVYQPEVAARVRQSYQKANLPQELLVNRDARPLTHLYALLLAARQSGASLTRFVTLLAVSGWIPFLVPILVFIALRTWALATPRGHPRASAFDSSFLVFSTGWIGIATVVILMYAYETHFGSLYLHVGVISSLFMVGLTAGAMVCSVLVRACREMPNGVTTNRLPILLVSVLLAHGLRPYHNRFRPCRSRHGPTAWTRRFRVCLCPLRRMLRRLLADRGGPACRRTHQLRRSGQSARGRRPFRGLSRRPGDQPPGGSRTGNARVAPGPHRPSGGQYSGSCARLVEAGADRRGHGQPPA